jgi:hypothetical protein
MKKKKFVKKLIWVLAIIVLLMTGFLVACPYIFKNSSLDYKKSNVEYATTFGIRDNCRMNLYQKDITDIDSLKTNKLVRVPDFFYSPGLNKCLYVWTLEDRHSQKHYQIKDVDTQKTVYEISPYNPLQRLRGQYSEDYLKRFAAKISEIPDIFETEAKINAQISANGPIKKCAIDKEMQDKIDGCASGSIGPRIEPPSQGELDAISQQCNSEEQKMNIVAGSYLIDPNWFGMQGGYVGKNLGGNYYEIGAWNGNLVSENNLLAYRGATFTAFWDGACWNITEVNVPAN